MMRAHVDLGASPASEDCAQCGSEGYEVRAAAEIAAYRSQVLRVVAAAGKVVPEGVSIRRKGNPHDFGTYYELVVSFDDRDEDGEAFAYWVESVAPSEWDVEARAELDGIAAGAADILDRIDHARAQQAAPNVTRIERARTTR